MRTARLLSVRGERVSRSARLLSIRGGFQRRGVHPDGDVSRGVCAHPLDPEVHPQDPKVHPFLDPEAPSPSMDRKTLVKTLPCPKLRLRVVKIPRQVT